MSKKGLSCYLVSEGLLLCLIEVGKVYNVEGVVAVYNAAPQLNLTKVTLPTTLKKLEWNAFSATGITSIVIPESDNLSALSEKVFFQCASLTEVSIPITITKIADDTFAECSDSLTIKGYASSYAISYAKSHNIKYQEMAR